MNASDWAAWYGAVVATAAFGVSIWSGIRDKASLFIKIQPGMKLTESYGDYSADHTYASITVANRGRRPITIGKVWFDRGEGPKRHVLVIDAFRAGQVDLPEGRNKDYLSRDDDFDWQSVRRICVEDGTGRKWAATVVHNRFVRMKVIADQDAR